MALTLAVEEPVVLVCPLSEPVELVLAVAGAVFWDSEDVAVLVAPVDAR